MKPYYDQDGVTIYHGDCREIMPHVSADAVVTDPPYGMNNDNNYARFTQGLRGHGAASSRTYPPTINDDKPFDPSPFLAFGRVILWGANHFSARLPVGTTLVWIKRNDGGFGSFLSDAEIAWMSGGHGVYCHRDTSMYSSPDKRTHPNEKPVGLMRWCVGMTEGSILDPFMGSGTTLVAAKQLGRKAIGIEIEERYCEIAAKRLAQQVLPLGETA